MTAQRLVAYIAPAPGDDREDAVPEEPTLRVPSEYVPALRALFELADDTAIVLSEALGERSSAYDRTEVVDVLTKVATGWDHDIARLFVDALLAIRAVHQVLNLPLPTVAEAVARAPDLPFEPEQREVLAQRLNDALLAPSITLIARAHNLSTEYERNFEEARIVTDIRPLFHPGTEEELDGAIISHSLRIRHSGVGASQALYISLDIDDLVALRSAVERAVRKANHLEAMLKSVGIPYIRPGAPIPPDAEGVDHG